MIEVSRRLTERRSLELKWHNQRGKKKGLLETLILTQLWATRPWRKSWSSLSIRHFRSEKGTVGTEMRPAIDSADSYFGRAGQLWLAMANVFLLNTILDVFAKLNLPQFPRLSFFTVVDWISLGTRGFFVLKCSGMHLSETCEKSWQPE